MTTIDLEFFLSVGDGRRRLDFPHTIGQNLLHSFFFSADRTCIETILDRTSKGDDPDYKNRHTDHDLVQSERATSVLNLAPRVTNFSCVTLRHTG